MKSLKSPTLYSRLALITSVTLVVGYFVVYAAWTGILDSEIAPSAVVTSTLMTKIKNNLEYLSGGLANFGFSTGNVGIGTSSPEVKFTIYGNDTPTGGIRINRGDTDSSNWIDIYNAGGASVFSSNRNGTLLNSGISTRFINVGSDGIRENLFIQGSTGNIGIGTISPQNRLHFASGRPVAGAIRIDRNDGVARNTVIGHDSTGFFTQIIDGDSYRIINSAGTEKLNFNPNTGNLTIVGTLSQASDLRLKEDMENLSGSLNKILQLNGISYKWKDTTKDTRRQIGVIAQDVEKIFPEVVATDEKGMKSVAYGNLVAPLIEAVKELKSQKDSEIAELRKEIQELKNK